jgi:hypothetical protein
MKRSFILISALALSAVASAQLDIISNTGSLLVNGGSPSGPLQVGDEIRMQAGNGTGSMATGSFRHLETDPNTFNFDRTAVKFKAMGDVDATYMLPSDRNGNMSSATEGESRTFGLWANNRFSHSHVLNASVEEGEDSLLAEIDIDLKQAPVPFVINESGTYTITMMDGQAYDLDPRPGFVKINKFATPSVTLNFTIQEMTFQRDEIEWTDGSLSNSMYRDDVYSSSWTLFDRVGGGGAYIFGSADSERKTFNAGDGSSTRTVDGWSSSQIIDFSTVDLGSYNIKNWAINWDNAGYDDDLGGLGLGGIRTEILGGELTVVPEPSGILLFGGLAAGFLLRRKK